MPETKKRIAIIGGGTSGVCAVKICLDYGLEPVCFEQKDNVGGLWYVQNPQPKHLDLAARVYDQLFMNASKNFYTYSDFPALKHHPYYHRPHTLMEYMDAYMDKHKLAPFIQCNTKVNVVEKAEDYEGTGRWNVTVCDALTKEDERTETFDGVFCCTGYYATARIPKPYPGQDTFKGSIIHAGKYWDWKPYEKRHVLLVGGSLSSFDIGEILAGHDVAHVTILSREGVWMMPQSMERSRSWECVLFQRSFRENASFEDMQEKFEKIFTDRYDHGALGLVPDRPIFQGRMGISDDADKWILSGRISTKKGSIARFTEKSVILDNGDEIVCDDIIWTTGYVHGFPYLKDTSIIPETTAQDVWWNYLYPINQSHPSIWLIGMFYVFAAMPPVAELQLRLACAVMTGASKFPSREEMLERIEQERQDAMAVYGRWPGMEVDGYSYWFEMAKYIGCSPDLEEIRKRNPKLAEIMKDSPVLPQHFRLLGPHSDFAMAEKFILDDHEIAYGRTIASGWKPPKKLPEPAQSGTH